MRYITFFAVLILAALGCTEDKSLKISGKVEEFDSMAVYFDRLKTDGSFEVLTKAKSDNSGSFTVTLPEKPSPGLYRLRFGTRNIDLPLGKEYKDVNITSSLEKLKTNDFEITGTPLASKFHELEKAVMSRRVSGDEFAQGIPNQDPIVGFAILNKFFKNNINLAPAHVKVANKLAEKYPDSYLNEDYKTRATAMLQAKKEQDAKQKVKIGAEAPEIALPDVKGKVRKLSDLRGKLVLLDFWASWCGPCRRDNPKVVKTYHKYKDKGFDVFSVSLDGLDNKTREMMGDNMKKQLDRQKERWLAAIKKDKLVWDSHVSDLKKWDSEAKNAYGITSIPKTFLIGRDGKILVINPRHNLEEVIKQHI